MVAYRSPGTRDLGAVQSRHHPGRFSLTARLFFAAVALAPPVAAIGAPLTDSVGGPERVVLTAFGILFPLGVLFLLALGIPRRRDEIVIHEQGCTQRARGAEIAFAWDEIVACRTEPISLEEGPVDPHRRFTLRLRNGARVAVPPDYGPFGPSRFSGAAPLGAAIERALLREVRAAFAQKRALRFGDIEVRADEGLRRGDRELAWSDLADVEVDEHRLLTLYRRPRVKWGVIDTDEMDNLDALLCLLKSRGALPLQEPIREPA